MRLATKKALLASIEHWRELERAQSFSQTKLGRDNCALCLRFGFTCSRHSDITGKMIELCPVRERTGKKGCYGSPYYDCCKADTIRDFRAAATLEREFLESLLPATTK